MSTPTITTFDVPGHVTYRDVSRPARSETRDERAWRLASKAVIEGIRIMREALSVEMFATSGSNSRTLYRVDVERRSCTCRGFDRTGLCKHLSLALAESGRLTPPPPRPVTPQSAAPARRAATSAA